MTHASRYTLAASLLLSLAPAAQAARVDIVRDSRFVESQIAYRAGEDTASAHRDRGRRLDATPVATLRGQVAYARQRTTAYYAGENLHLNLLLAGAVDTTLPLPPGFIPEPREPVFDDDPFDDDPFDSPPLYEASGISTFRLVFDVPDDEVARYRLTGQAFADRGPSPRSGYALRLSDETGVVFAFSSSLAGGDAERGAWNPLLADVGLLGPGRYTLVAQAFAAGDGEFQSAARLEAEMRIITNPLPAAATLGVSCVLAAGLRRQRRTPTTRAA